MYKGISIQDQAVGTPATFGAHIAGVNAAEPTAFAIYGNGGFADNFVMRKTDPLVMKGNPRSGRGYAHTARGRTWNFFFRVSTDNT